MFGLSCGLAKAQRTTHLGALTSVLRISRLALGRLTMLSGAVVIAAVLPALSAVSSAHRKVHSQAGQSGRGVSRIGKRHRYLSHYLFGEDNLRCAKGHRHGVIHRAGYDYAGSVAHLRKP